MMMGSNARPNWAEVDFEALERNVEEVRRLCGPDVRLLASIKADAYGHGVVDVCRVLQRHGVYALMTGSFDDAKKIRAAGITSRIVMFGGCVPKGVKELLSYDLVPTVYNIETAHAISAAADRQTPVYVIADAGLGRLGVTLNDLAKFVVNISKMPNIRVECIYTHLPFSDIHGLDWAKRRLNEFGNTLRELTDAGVEVPMSQACASSGLIAGLDDPCNAVCVGHLLYGVVPVSHEISVGHAFEPVLTGVKSRLIHIGRHSVGDDIAIGGLYGSKRSRVTGVLPIGLSDGMKAITRDRPAHCIIRGQRVEILATSLEHTVLDLDRAESAMIGDVVTLIGTDGSERITLSEFASFNGCSVDEVLMSFANRLPHGCID